MERAEKGEVIGEYQLLDSGINKEYNLRDSIVWYGVEKKLGPKLCSAQTFEVYEDAIKYADYLYDKASPHILRLIGLTKDGDTGIVFIERVLPLQYWIDRKPKDGMWRRRDGAGPVLGVGDHFKIIFQQLLTGLHYLHDNVKNAHNNLENGVYITPDFRRVMLGNFFFSDKMDLSNKKGDFTSFKAIFELAIQTDHPWGSLTSDSVKAKVHEVRLFILMLEKALKTEKSFRDCYEFLYNPFILWGPKKKRIFYDEFAYVVKLRTGAKKLDKDMFQHFKADWQTRIKPTTVWEDVLKHMPAGYYNFFYGPLLLIRNFDHHRPIYVDDVFELADELFPEALGGAIHSLLFGAFGSTPLNPNFNPKTKLGSQQPQKLARDYILKGLCSVLEYQHIQ